MSERIQRSVKGSGDNLESGDFSYERRRTFLKIFDHELGSTCERVREYPLSDTPGASSVWQYPAGRPVGPGRERAAAIGRTARPRGLDLNHVGSLSVLR